MRKSIALAITAVAASFFVSTAAHAVTGEWIGPTNSLWSNGAAWQGGIIPNAQADTAQFTNSISSQVAKNDVNGLTTINGITGVTVGTLRITGTAAASSMQFTPNQNIVMDADGTGPLRAQWINDVQLVSPGANTNAALFLNNPDTGSIGAFWLNDDLLISNTSNTTRTSGSIQVRGPIRGTGDIYVENITNNTTAGAIVFSSNESTGPGAGGFGGDIFIRKGAVNFTRGDIFTPTPGNIVTIGAVGSSDDVTLAFTGGGLGNMENGFVVAGNTTGNLIFAANATAATNNNVQIKTTNTNASVIQLDGNLSFDNRATNGSIFIIGDRVGGGGKLTKIGVGPMEITNTNTYSGGTVVREGSLKVRHADAFNNGFGFHDATDGTLGSSTVTVETTATRLEIDTTLAAINVIANTASLSLAGGGNANSPDQGSAALGSGINEVVGGLILGGIAQTTIGTYGSTFSSATFQNDEYFSGTGIITLTPDFNGDGMIDSGDYVVWRKFGGDEGAYNNWVANFGNAAGAGGGGSAGVPEPTTLVLLGLIAPFALMTRRHRT